MTTRPVKQAKDSLENLGGDIGGATGSVLGGVVGSGAGLVGGMTAGLGGAIATKMLGRRAAAFKPVAQVLDKLKGFKTKRHLPLMATGLGLVGGGGAGMIAGGLAGQQGGDTVGRGIGSYTGRQIDKIASANTDVKENNMSLYKVAFVLEKLAHQKRAETARRDFCDFLDFFVRSQPLKKQAQFRVLQAAVAAGENIVPAVKLAFPRLDAVRVGGFAVTLAKTAEDFTKLKMKKVTRNEATGYPGDKSVAAVMSGKEKKANVGLGSIGRALGNAKNEVVSAVKNLPLAFKSNKAIASMVNDRPQSAARIRAHRAISEGGHTGYNGLNLPKVNTGNAEADANALFNRDLKMHNLHDAVTNPGLNAANPRNIARADAQKRMIETLMNKRKNVRDTLVGTGALGLGGGGAAYLGSGGGEGGAAKQASLGMPDIRAGLGKVKDTVVSAVKGVPDVFKGDKALLARAEAVHNSPSARRNPKAFAPFDTLVDYITAMENRKNARIGLAGVGTLGGGAYLASGSGKEDKNS